MYYKLNKAKSRTLNTQKSLTDQAAASETDRNVIVKKFMVHGQVPTSTRPPIYADFTNLPDSLAGFLKQAQSIDRLKRKLPTELRDLTLDALLALTPEQVKERLKKPEPPAKPNEGTTT